GDREQLLEKRALAGVREAVELHGVLAHVEMGLEHDLGRALRLLDRRGRRVQPVANAVHVEDEPLGIPGDGRPAQARDHRAAPAATARASGAARMWQIATARASAAWC